MNHKRLVLSSLMLALVLICNPVFPDWQLDSTASSVSFTTVKNGAMVESHEFKSLSGTVTEAGKIEISIGLASVETMIPIRNERMQKMLFETDQFIRASLTANVSLAQIESLGIGASTSMDLKANLNLHGMDADLDMKVIVIRVSADSFHVSSRKPVVVMADQFGLVRGIDALRQIAGLSSITTAVPVGFSLLFSKR